MEGRTDFYVGIFIQIVIFQDEGNGVSFGDLFEDPGTLKFEAVVAEVESEDDNKFIFQSKKCSQDQLDYCAGGKFKSEDHTMCKYCVSFICLCIS